MTSPLLHLHRLWVNAHSDTIHRIELSPDGRFVAAADWDGVLSISPLSGTSPPTIAQCDPNVHVSSLRWLSSSSLLAGFSSGLVAILKVTSSKAGVSFLPSLSKRQLIRLCQNTRVLFEGWLPFWLEGEVTHVASHKSLIAAALGSRVEVWEQGLGGKFKSDTQCKELTVLSGHFQQKAQADLRTDSEEVKGLWFSGDLLVVVGSCSIQYGPR